MAQRRNYRTQWAAQFFAAGELARRGYLVALTQGNAERADLLVEAPSGVKFSVDVKGLATHNWWVMRERADTATTRITTSSSVRQKATTHSSISSCLARR